MKRTIRGKYTLLIAGVMGAMILILCLMNSLYLERYYISEKTKDMASTYNEVSTILRESSLEDEDTMYRLHRLFESSSISALVRVVGSPAAYIFGYEDRLIEQMGAVVYGQESEPPELMEQAEQYVVYRWHDAKLQSSYILLFGFLEGNSYCFLRSSLPGIKESAMISTRFTWMIGLVVILVSVLLVSQVSGRISGPITRLAQIADRMAHLDFSARYEGQREDEIGLLGASMNYMSEELERKISDLRSANLQLQRDIDEKVKVDEMRKDFISNVSHELKTPIALIQGYAEGLLEGISDDPESMSYYCEVIVDEAGKMNQLVRRLLTLNQIESGINEADPVEFDLIPVIKGVLHSFNILLQQKNIVVEFDAVASLPIRADEFMIEEVIRNYISNAIHHMEGEMRLEIGIEQKDGSIKISVFNTGQPIPESDLSKVWQKFYKVDKARTREYGGSGIGLSIVKAVMDSHEGTCGVYNREDGVCFWFELKQDRQAKEIDI
ncbi:MAG: HAMP domain-containing protein [Lachnospiraceae bacterium]|nr:HAMP domain-containing protein [Lachnospiraceae bacterium]